MDRELILKKVAAMHKKTYMYNGIIYKLNGWHVTDNEIFISTNVSMLVFTFDNFPEKKKEFYETSDESSQGEVSTSPNDSKPVNHSSINMQDTLKTLEETIAMVKCNPDYLKQAQAINATVGTMTKLAQIELAFKKEIRAASSMNTSKQKLLG